MRLLTWNTHGELILTDDLIDNIPPYSILSHTWGPDKDEVTFADIEQGRGHDKIGYQKILFCGEQTRKDGVQHFWVDTCCINKQNHVELSEAITSMFRWYRNAHKCYVYLADVSADRTDPAWEDEFQNSRWFTRGWTLQELLAPRVVEFFSSKSQLLGTKETLTERIHEITTIPVAALRGTSPTQFPIDERIRWTEKRKTKRKEDMAYCLLGLFDVFMPLIYGEGDNALHRLKNEIDKNFGGNVAARLGCVDKVGPARSPVNAAPQTDPGISLLRSPDFETATLAVKSTRMRPAKRTREVSSSDESRLARRARPSYVQEMSTPSNGLGDDDEASSPWRIVTAGDHSQHSIQNSMTENKYETLQESLLFDRINFRVTNVEKALLSTCQWLFRHPDFQTWHRSSGSDRHSGFLWIKGKPGSGKSTLMKAALEWTRRQAGEDRDQTTFVPYFFNARAPTLLEKSSLGLYRTAVHQLLSRCPALRTIFTAKFAFKDPGKSGENWTMEELQDFLNDAVESQGSFRLCLFIDALDEAKYDDDVRHMIEFLIQLSDRALATNKSCRIQICLSSRHYPHISIGRGLSLVVEKQIEHGQDIRTYIAERLTLSQGLQEDDLRARISEKSSGVFLWVVLVVKMLNKLEDCGASVLDMKACLETIPARLNDLFREILQKDDHEMEISTRLFQWVLFSMRPLEPMELFVALEYSKPPYGSMQFSPIEVSLPDSSRLARFILNCSRGLVEIVEVGASRRREVQFIHETVREYLLSDTLMASSDSAMNSNLTGRSHNILRTACLRYIFTNDIPPENQCYRKPDDNDEGAVYEEYACESDLVKIHLKLPFMTYAVSHLFFHAEQAQKHGISQKLFLSAQIDRNGLWLDHPRQWWNVHQEFGDERLKSDVTLIYFIAAGGHSNLLQVLLSISDTVNNVCGPEGSALQHASYFGHQGFVQILLDHGADVNLQGGFNGSALQAASHTGNKEIVQILLDHGADINLHGGYYGNALQAASIGGDRNVVQILLDHGADVNLQGGFNGSALQAASHTGNKEIVQILLDHGADVNLQGGFNGSALQAASIGGKEEIVQILLDSGADVNAQGGYYGNALQAASLKGYEKVVRVLLGKDADTNAQGGAHGSALRAASENGHEKVVQMLLDNGAKGDSQGRSFDSVMDVLPHVSREQLGQLLKDLRATARIK